MGDASRERASSVNRITGQDENNVAIVTINSEVAIRDTHDNGGLDTIIALTTTPIEGKVSSSAKTERKYIIMEALTKNVKWGFSNSTQSFDLFKSQLIMVPIGANTDIWLKTTTGSGSVAFAELS